MGHSQAHPARDRRGERGADLGLTADENLDLEFEEGEWVELGDGRVVSDVHEVYRVKATGDFAYERNRQIELTIRDGQISRYEMRIVG